MSSGGGVLVEFCGLPGTGKTTLARSVADHLRERVCTGAIADVSFSAATSRSRRIAYKAAATALEAARHPRATFDAGRWAVASRQESARDTVAWLAQWLTVRQAVARSRRRPGLQLIEEGIVQSLWTLGLRARRENVARLVAGTPRWARGDLLVVVDAPIDVVLRRLAARPSRHSRTQQLSPDARAMELRRGQALLADLVAASGVPVLRLDNERPDGLPELARRVADHVLHDSPA